MTFKKYLKYFRLLLLSTIVVFIVIVGTRYLFTISFSKFSVQSKSQYPTVIVANPQKSISAVTPKLAAQTTPTVTKIQQTPVSSSTFYGHFPYTQANPNQVITIASYATGQYQRFEFMAPEAAQAIMKMIYAAREQGVWIVPVSGFRTIEQQQKLFQEQIKRRRSAQEAAKVSAPPGYSEHHTGYAVDLADGNFPKQDITLKFESTDAYRWLNVHGKEFGFELSFYKNNPQGVSYEPWHWRYVGSKEAASIFAQARRVNSIGFEKP